MLYTLTVCRVVSGRNSSPLLTLLTDQEESSHQLVKMVLMKMFLSPTGHEIPFSIIDSDDPNCWDVGTEHDLYNFEISPPPEVVMKTKVVKLQAYIEQ